MTIPACGDLRFLRCYPNRKYVVALNGDATSLPRSDRRDIAAASWMGDGGAVVVSHDRAVALIDELRRQERLLGVVHSQRAALMVQFGDVRRRLDQQVIGELTAGGGREVRFRAATATPQASSPTGPA